MGNLQSGLLAWDRDIVDGGEGYDILDFAYITNDLEVDSDTQGYDNFNLEIDRTFNLGSTTYAYNIEYLKTGSGDDEVDLDLNSGSTLDRLDTNGGDDEVKINLFPNTLFKILDTGSGDDEVRITGAGVQPGALNIFLGSGNDVLLGSVLGSVVYGGSGNDTFHHGKDYMIADLEAGDNVSLFGRALTGGVRNANSETPWARGLGGERYGINTAAANDNILPTRMVA